MLKFAGKTATESARILRAVDGILPATRTPKDFHASGKDAGRSTQNACAPRCSFLHPAISRKINSKKLIFKLSVLILLSFPLCIRSEDTTNNAGAGSPPPEHRIFTGENKRFLVFSYNARSATLVAETGDRMGAWLENELKLPENILTGKIVRVELVPQAIAEFPGPYNINDNADQITLYLRWGKETTRDAMLRGIAHAYLARTFQVAGVRQQPSAKIPDWLITALAGEIEVQQNPALLDIRKRDAERNPIPAIEIFTQEPKHPAFTPCRPGSADYASQAFWFWRHLRRKLGTGNAQRELFLALSSDETLDAFLEKKFPDIWKDPDRKALWWPVSLAQIVRERLAPTMTMREAREYLENAASFVFAPDGTDKRYGPAELIALRELPAVKNEVLERRQRLRADIARANPVWHNAWRAYGIFLEKFDDPKTTDEQLHKRWDVARTEAAVAAILETEARAALNR